MAISAAELVYSFKADATRPLPLAMIGMARQAGSDGNIMFSPGGLHGAWVSIPISMIDEVELLGRLEFEDHIQNSVRITFKVPSSPEAQAFAEMLRRFMAPLGGSLSRSRDLDILERPDFLSRASTAPIEEISRNAYAVTCRFGCENGDSIRSTGYGPTPAAARDNAESRASIYCATRGGIAVRYPDCSVYP